MDLQQTTIHLPPILHSEVRRRAEARGMSMSEMTRRALLRYLDLEPRDLLQAALRLESRQQAGAWQSVWTLMDSETTTAYHVLHDLISLNMSAEHRTGILLTWLDAAQEQDLLQGERATLLAAACLSQPSELKAKLLSVIEEDLNGGRTKIRHRVAHLLDRIGRPPVVELLDLISRHPESSVLPGYLSHLCRRNTVADFRQELVASAAHGLSSRNHDVVMRALDLSAALRAGELIGSLADISQRNDDLGYSALVALGAISAKAHGIRWDGLFTAESPLSYRRVEIDRPLPVPSWQQWSVREDLRQAALCVLIRRAESIVKDTRAAAPVINSIARSDHPMGLEFLKGMVTTVESDDSVVGPLVANALGQFDSEEARAALQDLSTRGSAATRRAALKLLHSRRPAPEELSAGPPTELFTLASLLRALAVNRVEQPIHEMDLNQYFSALSTDHATARRWMVGLGLMDRENNEYRLTPTGELISVVETWLEEHGVRGARRIELLRHTNET